MSGEWDVEQCRSEYRRMRDAFEAEQREHQRTAADLVRTRYTVELQLDRIVQLQTELAERKRELDAANQRERALARELSECKRQGEAGGTRLATVTPLFPPKPERER